LEPIDTGFQCLIRILMVINFLISWTNLVLFMHCFVTATAIQLIWCFAPTKRGYLTSAVLAFVAGVGCVYMGVELFPLFTSADARRLTEHRLDPRGDDDGCYYDDDDYYDNIFGRIVDVEKIDAALEVSTATDCEFGTTEILRSIGCDETVVGAFAAFGSGALWFMVVDCILRIVKASWREAATRRDYRSSDGESDGGGGGGGAADRSVGLESDDEGDLIVRRALMVVAEGFAATVADHDRTAETARLDSSWQEPAQGLDDDDDDDDDDDGDDDDGSATTTTTTAAAGTSSSASSCLARIATDRSEKNRAQQVHVSKRIQDARDRAVVVVVAKNNNNTLTTIQPSLLLDDNNNNNSNSNSNNNTNSSGGEAMMALAPKPEWRIGATPQRNNVTTNATTNVSSSSSSSLPSSSLPSSLGLAYANIEIAGMPKAGTSHLYNLLTQRPDTIRFWGGKEYCAGKGKLFVTPTLSQLHKFHDRAFTRNSNEREKRRSQQREDDEPLVSVNGCIYLPDAIGRYEYLWGDAGSSSEGGGGGGEQEGRKKHQQQQKFVILLRDPADWLWSAWNFWIQPSFDVTVLQHDWADYKVNYRSPELFHELLLAGPDGILDFPGHAETFRRIGEEEIRRLRELAGTENVLVLKNEDMRPDLASANGGLLDVLSDFTGLNRSLFDDDLVQSYSNCNDKPGEKQRCTSAPSGYEIDGNRPMLPESRELVYLYFRQECRYWSKELNVHYPDCVNVRPTLPWPDVVVVDDHDDDDDGVGTPPPPP